VLYIAAYDSSTAIYVGYTATGSFWGSVIATFAVVLPSFILMLTISKFFLKYQKHPVIEAVFKGLRPGIVGLLASAVLVLMTTENFGSPQTDLYTFLVSSTLFVGVFIASKVYKVNPILLIVICGVMGFILY
jgi:chromate transporter